MLQDAFQKCCQDRIGSFLGFYTATIEKLVKLEQQLKEKTELSLDTPKAIGRSKRCLMPNGCKYHLALSSTLQVHWPVGILLKSLLRVIQIYLVEMCFWKCCLAPATILVTSLAIRALQPAEPTAPILHLLCVKSFDGLGGFTSFAYEWFQMSLAAWAPPFWFLIVSDRLSSGGQLRTFVSAPLVPMSDATWVFASV